MRICRSSRRVRITSLLAAGALFGSLVGLAPGEFSRDVGAQNIEDLRASARRAADELARLRHESDVLNEKYLQTQEEIAELKQRQETNRQEVDAAKARLGATRQEASDYLVEAYVGAGVDSRVVIGSSDPNTALNQRVLLSMLKGDRVELADDLEIAKQNLEALTEQLQATGDSLERRRSDQASIVASLESSVSSQQAILDGANTELNSAIRAEQERREAEAAARARAEAERAEARRAQEQRAQAQRDQAQRAEAQRARAAQQPRPRSGEQPRNGAPTFVAPPVASPPSSGAAGAIAAARTRLGTPYRWGGTTPAGFDCSGLMLWSWAQVGVSLPRTSGAQKAATQRISRDQLQPGDLVFSGNPVYHVGMYIGGGMMIHSPHTGDVVKISPVRGGGSVSYGRVG